MTDLYSILSCKSIEPHSTFKCRPTFETQPYPLANVYTDNFYTTSLVNSELTTQSLRSMNLSSKPSTSSSTLNLSNANLSISANQQIYRQWNDRPVPQIRINSDLSTIESAVQARLRMESMNNTSSLKSTQY